MIIVDMCCEYCVDYTDLCSDSHCDLEEFVWMSFQLRKNGMITKT